MTEMERRWDDEDDDSHHRSRYNGSKQHEPANTTAAAAAPGNGNKDEDDEPVDEFGRPLRPGRESSDSDSDHDYRSYRRRSSRGDGRRDNRYSPDNNRSGGVTGGSNPSGNNRKRDHSPSNNGPDKRNRDLSPRDNFRRRREDWNDRSNDFNGRQSMNNNNNQRNGRGGDERSLSPVKSMQQSNTGTGQRRPKRGDIFEGGVFKTYKQFLDYQDDSITPTDAEKKYEEYKVEFSKRQARIFFKDHQTEEWFREKYDPVFLKKKKMEKMEFAKTRIPGFITMLEDENFNFNLTAKDNIKDSEKLNSEGMDIDHDDNEHEQTDEHHEGEEKSNSNNSSSDITSTTANSSTANPTTSTITNKNNTLFIKAISPTCTKDDLLEVLNKAGNEEEPVVVTKLTLSEPMKYKNFYRLGWVTFKTSEFAMKALKELNGTKMRDFELYLTINKQVQIDAQKKFRITPKIASTEQRISTDLKQAVDIAKNLDVDRDITNNPLWSDQYESLSEMDRLDRTIHYLRHTHLFCYYCSEEYSDVDEIERKCGSVHLRRPLSDDTNIPKPPKPADEMTDDTESNNNNEQDQSSMDIDHKPSEENTWVINLDNNIKAKIIKINNQEQYEYTQAIAKSAEEFIQINTFKMEEEKYRCSLCCKLFKGSEYVKKHINLKHPEELKEDSHKKGTEEQFFLNYFSDPRRMTPPTQQQLLYYQNPRGMMSGMPRPRWNPTLGAWEPQMVIPPQMIPGGMIPSTPPMAMGGQMYPVSPLFTSPNVRGRGLPIPIAVPMRRGYPQQVGGASQPNVMPSPAQNVRYRPYPTNTQRAAVPVPPADPRGIREYVDLDAAPTGANVEIDYTAALKQYQSKRTNQ